jgi:ankyrin repeat protein
VAVEGKTPLLHAIQNGNAKCVELLLDAGYVMTQTVDQW